MLLLQSVISVLHVLKNKIFNYLFGSCNFYGDALLLLLPWSELIGVEASL